ncbi:MAG: DEAD/DEAH box helicase [Parachlamydiales bacterium]|nr:DEAD/DEAH box helicase [Parachlamydiales bacterium]
MPFQKFNFHSTLLDNLSSLGYKFPTPVQNQVIPQIFSGVDLRVSAPTGTGKTAAFLLPVIQRLFTSHSPSKKKGPRALILVPTRELAMQVTDEAKKYSKAINKMKTICICGGVEFYKQNRELNLPHEIVVATPGRLIDQLARGRISLARIEIVVLDEADRMLDMGFSESVQEIFEELPSKPQTLLFSATLKGNVLALSKKLLNKPMEINIELETHKKENIDQSIFYVDDIHHKQKILVHLLDHLNIEQAIIFTSTKIQAEKLTQSLLDLNYLAASLHGDMNQRQRTKTINQLRNGRHHILVATDVAARGIDVRTISHVINFDLPRGFEDYVHRIGRTARAEAKGTAISFASNKEGKLLALIEKQMGKKIEIKKIPGLEPKKNLRASDKKSFSHRKPPFKNKNRRNFFQKKKSSRYPK